MVKIKIMKIKHLESDSIFEIFTTRSGGEERQICPVCSKDRRKNRVKCFSWNHDKNTGYCSHCQGSFVLSEGSKSFEYVSREKREYKRPEWNNNTELSEKLVKWFENRGISQFTLRQMKITEGKEWMPQTGREENTVQFNYFRNKELINTKFRDGRKNFKFTSGAELILYNLDSIVDKEQIIIVEGEIDALSCYESGLHNVVSVPNGAGTGTINFEYIDNCISYFENVKEIIIATDNDAPGINLKNQLAHRFGIERCFKVDFSPYKDSNDILVNEGAESLKNRIIQSKKPFPIDGVFNANDFEDDLDLLYERGLQPGKQIEIPEFDELISFETGRLYTWTGIPGHGKSEFLDYVLERLNIIHGWKIGYFSPENHPLQLHASKIIEKLTGEKFSKHTLDTATYEGAKEYIKDNFFFVNPSDDYKVETILEKARILVFKYGIKAFVIDPYNKLEHQFSNNESQYISQFLDKIINFAKRNNISMHLVAHPRKMNKTPSGLYEVPNLYDINGSSNFYNKTDFGITVYRDMQTAYTTVYVQKVKFKHLGKPSDCKFMWNCNNGRYAYFPGDVNSIDWDNQCHLNINKDVSFNFYENEKYHAELEDDFLRQREPVF